MKTLVQISDEVIGGDAVTWQLELADEELTVRELIRSRVYQEVQDANLKRQNQHQLLITLANPAESSGKRTQAIGNIDWRNHFEQAVVAYDAGRFLLLVDDHQTESLDEVVKVGQLSQITFLKLFPLVGG